MKEEQRELQRKLHVLEHANMAGNIRMTCHYFGVGRSTFYRWKSTYDKCGESFTHPLPLK